MYKSIRMIVFLTVHGSVHVIQQNHTSIQTLSPVGQGSPHAEDELPLPLLQASTYE